MKVSTKIKNLNLSGRLLVRNTLLNFVAQAIPLLVGVITIPFIIRGLGTEQFGLLSLSWIILGYFSIFDLGLGRATTKFIAEALGKGKKEDIPQLVWTSVSVQIILGIAGGFVFALFVPFLVEHVLKISPELVREAKASFYLLALAVPVVLIFSSFQGVLEATQRFDLLNIVKIPLNIMVFIIPLIGVFFEFKISGIVALILIIRFLSLLVLVTFDFYLFPRLRKISASFRLFLHLFSFGGWVTISSIVSPILMYLDRFLIGSILSLSAVTYYTVPYEVITRLLIIPISLTITLFPAFSALWGVEDKERIKIFFIRAVKYLLFTLGVIIFLIIIFAKEILQFWLGDEFVEKSAQVLQILSFGVLINSLAHVPYSLLQGIGRPDLTAKFHLFELFLYIGIAWFLVVNYGINGAALAWAIRVTIDAILLFMATFKIYELKTNFLRHNGITATFLVLLILGFVGYILKILLQPFGIFAQIIVVNIVLLGFIWICWNRILDEKDKEVFSSIVKLSIKK